MSSSITSPPSSLPPLLSFVTVFDCVIFSLPFTLFLCSHTLIPSFCLFLFLPTALTIFSYSVSRSFTPTPTPYSFFWSAPTL